MKLFVCANCGNLLYFENVRCVRCGAALGFLADRMELSAIELDAGGQWRALDGGRRYRMCANYSDYAVCNWMLEADSEQAFCIACSLNGTIPDLSVAGNHALWHTMEAEKRQLIYSMLRLRLPVTSRRHDPTGLQFEFLADTESSFSERGRVLTGHADGVITINIAEADPAERERLREQMAEPYRTILGHFRHESGHYFWDRLIRDSHWLTSYRELFGDETRDYGQALEAYYRDGPPPAWQERYVSAYASMHPWEDWAETWAHFLHIADTLETAYQFGLSIRPRAVDDDLLDVQHDFDAYRETVFETIIEHWLPLTFALNSLNRSMGHGHAYPFVLSPAALEKLRFIHRVVTESSAR